MSIGSIMNTGSSGLNAAQTNLRVIADNIANANTPGYVRKLVDQSAYQSNGMGAGVEIARIRQAANVFLEAAGYSAAADAAQAGVVSELLDRAQSLFGDPTADQSYFNKLSTISADFDTLAADPTAGLKKAQVVVDITSFLNESRSIYTSLTGIQSQADTRLKSNLETINGLLADIDKFNAQIRSGSVSGDDVTGSINAQAGLIKALSSLMDIRVASTPQGGVSILGGDSMSLVGSGSGGGHAVLSYKPNSTGFGDIIVTEAGGAEKSLKDRMTSGEMIGLLQLRDHEIPAVANQLGELVSHAADALNRAHNAASAVPAPQTLTGRNTGLDMTSAVTGFAGVSTIAVMDTATNTIARSVKIDFTAQTISVNGGAASAFTPATFLSSLNAALGTDGTATFANGALSLSGVAGKGMAIADDATNPANKVGRGFSHFFGLNDLVQSSGISTYETGLTVASNPGFTPGKVLGLRLTGADGQNLADVNITTPPGPATMGALLAAMNDPDTGVGKYGSYALDTLGRMTFTPSGAAGVTVSVRSDTTERGMGTPSMSQLFGLGDNQRASRLFGYSVRSDIAANPSKLALAKLDLAPAAGQLNLRAGDGRGGKALAQAGTTLANFDAAGNIVAGTSSINQYSAQVAGALARRASQADMAQKNAAAIETEVENRRSSAEDVNTDEELAKMTTYSQAYNASARLVTAAKDLYDILLNMVG